MKTSSRHHALKKSVIDAEYLLIYPLHFRAPFKKIFFFALIVPLFFLTAQAQTSHSRRKENFDIKEFRSEKITIATPSDRVTLTNIHGITVIDARADTFSIGFMQKKVIDPFFGALNNAVKNQAEQRINRTPTFITLGGGLQQEAAQFTARCVVFSGNQSLPGILMVIKKLWLSDELNLDEQTHTKLNGTDSRDVWTSGVDVKIEFYLKDRSDYYPLYRYDTVMSKTMTVSEYGPEFVANALSLSMQKMPQMDTKITSIMGRKKFSLEEISRHNEDDFNMPALKDTSLRKGVYMTFDEFKNNNPSQTHFELKEDKLTDIIYIKQPDGTEYVARDIWGYCNGEKAFIKSADNFFLLQRAANAFYIFGAKNIKRTETNTTSAASYNSGNSGMAAPVYYTSSKTAIQLEPFQLDWSTGKLY
jgi:hypothetical protein